tara:strand:- start:20987 stop:21814 length:828 start_codon:yes stop_codon:yes gene_type:complete
LTRPTKVTILGPTGRLGRALCNAVLDSRDFTLVGAIVRSESPAVGQDIGEMLDRAPAGCEASVSFEAAAEKSDIILDASLPAMTVSAAERLAVMPPRCGLITGVTGFNPDQARRIEAVAPRIPLLMAGNFSLGVAITEALVAQAARMTSEAWDIEISETHHRNKADAPSGTALTLGRAAARARGVSLESASISGRDGMTGKRPAGAIGFASSRGGAVVGEHMVRFLGEMEEISIAHRAYDRAVFARGALAAAHWLCNDGASRPPGAYSMQDVVGG